MRIKVYFETLLIFFVLLLVQHCDQGGTAVDAIGQESATMSLLMATSEYFGETPFGSAKLYSFENKNGMKVSITNYGGIITKIMVPDKEGQLADVVLGFDSLAPYLQQHPFFGAIIGRYGNRIAKGAFQLNGKEYTLATNNGPNHLHGGPKGFDKVLWNGTLIKNDENVGVVLTYQSKDMEEGYPGNLDVKVTYLLNNHNELAINYEAETDQPTICNLTNHSYFNLKGAGNGHILDHELLINAAQYTPVDETLIPTGEMAPVEGTPFDFRHLMPIGERVNVDHQQIKHGGGYDHNFVLNAGKEEYPRVAKVHEPTSGRLLEVFSSEPGVQFYCGNFLDGTITGKGGKVYGHRSGFCLETQHFPDSPNHEHFPSVVLNPGELYQTSTIFRFSTEE